MNIETLFVKPRSSASKPLALEWRRAIDMLPAIENCAGAPASMLEKMRLAFEKANPTAPTLNSRPAARPSAAASVTKSQRVLTRTQFAKLAPSEKSRWFATGGKLID